MGITPRGPGGGSAQPPGAAMLCTHSLEGLGAGSPGVSHTHRWRPATWRRWGWRLRPLHMHQQRAPRASTGGQGKAGHSRDAACSGRMALGQAQEMLGEKRSCRAHGQDPPSPLPGPASVTISIRVFSPNTGTQNTQLVGAP